MTAMTRRGALLGAPALALALALAAARGAAAQDYPARPVRVVIGFAAGGATDIMARLLSRHLSARLGGQPFVIENRPGAGTLLAAEAVARAAADGHTLTYASSSTVITPLINRGSSLDVPRDFAAVAIAQASPMILVANAGFPARTIPEIVALAQAQPGRITIAHPGTGGINHLSLAILMRRTGAEFTLVPFTGNQPALNALLRGDVDLASDSLFATRPLLEAGRIRPVAVTTARRSPLLPEVPAIAEHLPGYDVPFWSGFLAPRATPPAIVDRLNREVEEILKLPEVLERLRGFGAEPVGGSRESFQRLIEEEWRRWGELVRALGLRGD
ncbi:Bug family tripartite tricarboxylate transporter substrate binding protein [Caldovatus aquaticus]|uniref:Tripartite tricarboxylate transporter substrate binding protein n=1 Tax=Caldovatus aquaticus TaxID=2865671 RepID=A0ABS7F800_9PROT|nr:tripartite tricarboxylate transporter substrate binding protein [Caldovatus aquaticus]MBW8270951.1 tripartite tricarboxylate transporter substrate binding protein [Caldovatus aquaticus]